MDSGASSGGLIQFEGNYNRVGMSLQGLNAGSRAIGSLI